MAPLYFVASSAPLEQPYNHTTVLWSLGVILYVHLRFFYLDLVTFAIFSYYYILDAIVSHSLCSSNLNNILLALAHGSTWCHLLCFVFDNLSIKLNLMFG